MAELHNGILNTLYGKIDSDKKFNSDLQHLQKLKRDTGVDYQYFRNKYNQIMLKHSGKWYTYTELSKHLKVLQYD